MTNVTGRRFVGPLIQFFHSVAKVWRPGDVS